MRQSTFPSCTLYNDPSRSFVREFIVHVKLITDLTKYHPSLTEGAIGEMIGPYGKHSREIPKAWVGVRFEHCTLDILRKQLEVVRGERKDPIGPQLPVQSTQPPKVGQIVEFGGVEFKVVSIQERLGPDLWLLNLEPR